MDGQGLFLPLMSFLAGAGFDKVVGTLKKLQQPGATAKGPQASMQAAAQQTPQQAMGAALEGRHRPGLTLTPQILQAMMMQRQGMPPGAPGPPGAPPGAPAPAINPLALLAMLQQRGMGGGA